MIAARQPSTANPTQGQAVPKRFCVSQISSDNGGLYTRLGIAVGAVYDRAHFLDSGLRVAIACGMPYRIDISSPPDDALDQLVQLGALDIETFDDGLAAIIPDGVTPEVVAHALGVADINVSPAIPRDNGSVWLLRPRALRIGSVLIAPTGVAAPAGTLRLTDSTTFGTGHHPTTALCIEALEGAVNIEVPDSVLDVGTGSGVLALAALMLGVRRAVGLDIDADALKIAAEHSRLNNLADRLQLVP